MLDDAANVTTKCSFAVLPLVIVTENARDFRKLIGNVELHCGLILLPAVDREKSWRLLQEVIEFLTERGDPMQVMVNHVAEIDFSGRVTLSQLPTAKW